MAITSIMEAIARGNIIYHSSFSVSFPGIYQTPDDLNHIKPEVDFSPVFCHRSSGRPPGRMALTGEKEPTANSPLCPSLLS